MAGLQIFTDDKKGFEHFYPRSKMRLFKLLYEYGTRVVFFSGDIHHGEF